MPLLRLSSGPKAASSPDQFSETRALLSPPPSSRFRLPFRLSGSRVRLNANSLGHIIAARHRFGSTLSCPILLAISSGERKTTACDRCVPLSSNSTESNSYRVSERKRLYPKRKRISRTKGVRKDSGEEETGVFPRAIGEKGVGTIPGPPSSVVSTLT